NTRITVSTLENPLWHCNWVFSLRYQDPGYIKTGVAGQPNAQDPLLNIDLNNTSSCTRNWFQLVPPARSYNPFSQNIVLLATAVLNNSFIISPGSQIVWGRYDPLKAIKGTYAVYKNLLVHFV
ncbi:hypothetical protein HAX54_050030, partial [Datura stramonium]|nr:hypothetical protein [Datura stramonium]